MEPTAPPNPSSPQTILAAEELTQRIPDQYHALFHAMDQGFCVLELQFDDTGEHVVDFRYQTLNPVFFQQSGMPEDTLGKTARELMPDLEPFWFDTYGRVVRTGESVRLEYYVSRLGRWFDVHVFRVGAPETQQVGMLFADITARKQREQQQGFLLRFSDALRAETGAARVADRALGLLGEQLRLDRCYVGLYDLAGDRGIFPHQVGNHRIPPLPATVRLSDFPDALRVAHDRTLVIDDLAHTEGLSDADRQNLGALGLRALVAATLRRGAAEPQWAIVALSADVRHWTPGEVALLEEATERTWAAMERAHAEEASRLAEESYRTQLEQQVAARTQELQESRRLLQTVFDTPPTSIVVTRILRDAAGQPEDLEVLLVNAFTRGVVGRDDLAGQRYSVAFPQTRPTGVLARLLAVARTGEPADFEQWYVGEGIQQWFRSIAVRQDDLLVLTSEVITARKQAEQERTRTLRLLEQAETVAGLGSWDYDLLTQEFRWSEGMYQLFGLPLGQAIEPHIYLDFVVDEDRSQAEEFVCCLTTGCADFEETLRLRVGGQVKTVRLKVVVVHDEAGQPVRTLGVDLDISQLQRLEADNLRLRLTQQRALFEAVQAAQETERRRMAESLHNGIGQTLYATKLRLDQLDAPLLNTNAALVSARNEATRLLSEAIRQTRALSHELVPMALEKFGLAVSLQDIGSNMSTPQLRLRCQVQLDEDAGPLAPALQMALYRMAQELALNIVKHARGATAASLELETMPGWALLRAEDNGAGFATLPADSSGLGLSSIRDRVALLGGQLETGAAPTGGAYVRIRIPIPSFPAP